MARKLRIEYPGAIYHVMNRGERQEPIFEDDAGKVRIARRLRRETTVSKRWMAERLAMGSVSNVTFCLKSSGNRE